MASASTVARASDALRALREKFRETSAGTIATFDVLLRALSEDPQRAETLASIRQELHRIHGTAGSFGFMDASELAEKLEHRVERWEADPQYEFSQRGLILGHFVSALRLTLASETIVPKSAVSRRRMLLIEVAPALARVLRSTAALRGYAVTSWPAAELSVASLREQSPHVIVAPSTSISRVLEDAGPANVPVISITVAPPPGVTEPAVPEHVARVTMTHDPSELFGIADRLCLGVSWTGATILVVDDDPSVLAIVLHLLESEGVRVSTCDDPREMHQRLAATAPSLLLMDLRLGDVSGIDLTRELRTLPAYRDLPVVLVSADVDESMRTEARDAGVDDFLVKPIAATDLRECLARHLERQRTQRLGDGRHPGTGLSLPPRTAADAAAFVERAREQQTPAALAIVRPDVLELTGDIAAEWLRETQRLAHAVAGTDAVVGYHDGVALIAAVSGDGDVAESLFEALATGRDESTPLWRCGIAEAADFDYDLVRMRRAADDAIEEARQRANGVVCRWRRDDASRAPDVILVEDDIALSEMLQYVLRLSHLSYRAFTDGQIALDALLAFRAHGRAPLVLLDVDLPALDGHTLHDRLRDERPGAYAVVFITAHATETDQVRALRAGALDYVAKPVSYRTLMGKVPLWRERAAELARRSA